MHDIFSFSRGKILFESVNPYDRAFSESRSKTTEHSIYERSEMNLAHKSENSQKLKNNDEKHS